VAGSAHPTVPAETLAPAAPVPAETSAPARRSAPVEPLASPPPVVETVAPANTVGLLANAALRAQPRPGSAVMAMLLAGTRVKVDPRAIHNKAGDWCFVEYRDQSGWILKSALPD
jgi:hypothetical protein